MAQSLGHDYDYLLSASERILKGAKTKINLNKFAKLHPAIQRLILRRGYAKLKGDTRRLTYQHIREIEDLISHRPTNSIVDLPKGIAVVKQKNCLIFYLRKQQ
jgi:hypothetical protein